MRSVSLRPLWRCLAPYRVVCGGALLALLVTACATLALGYGIRMLVDEGIGRGDMSALGRTLLVFMGLIIVVAAGSSTRFYLVSWLGERVVSDLRRAVFGHLLYMHPGFFEANHVSQIQSRVTADTTVLQTVIGSSVSIALRNFLILVGALIMLMVTDMGLSLMAAISAPLIVLPIVLMGRRIRGLSRQSQDAVAGVGGRLSEALQQIKVVQAYTSEAMEQQRFAHSAELAFNTAVRRIRQRSLLVAVAILLVFGAISGMLWVGGSLVISGAMTPGQLAAFMFYALMIGVSVGAISEVFGDLQRAAGATERLMELLQTPADLRDAPHPVPLPAGGSARISIENLTFSYASRPQQPALVNLTCTVQEGETVALVGASGAGKSTLFDLLLRFHDPQQGCIRLGDTDIRHLRVSELRRQYALVPQEMRLFAGSIADNIRYGTPGADDAAVRDAAQAAFADDFISELAQGYDTQVGEFGARLSGGQKQRIAIARAMLRAPQIFLLDEVTSALDAESEHMVRCALDSLMAGRTALIIAHRMSTAMSADRILLMNRGQLIAEGSHEYLLRHSETYSRLVSLQFLQPETADRLVAERL